jgi:hypothetical protein
VWGGSRRLRQPAATLGWLHSLRSGQSKLPGRATNRILQPSRARGRRRTIRSSPTGPMPEPQRWREAAAGWWSLVSGQAAASNRLRTTASATVHCLACVPSTAYHGAPSRHSRHPPSLGATRVAFLPKRVPTQLHACAESSLGDGALQLTRSLGTSRMPPLKVRIGGVLLGGKSRTCGLLGGATSHRLTAPYHLPVY